MTAIPTWQFAILCLLALPTVIVAAIVAVGWAIPAIRRTFSNARASLAHSAMLRREHRRGNWQQFLHD